MIVSDKLAELNSNLDATLNIMVDHKSQKDFRYKTHLNSGTFTTKSNLGTREELDEEDGLRELLSNNNLDFTYGIYRAMFPKIYDDYLGLGEPEYRLAATVECDYVKETRTLILKSFMHDIINHLKITNMKRMLDYNTYSELCLLYYKNLPNFTGLLSSLQTKFSGLIYIPNTLSELEGCTLDGVPNSIGSYQDYIFEKRDYPTPVMISQNGYAYSSIQYDNPMEFTRVYRAIDVVNFIGEDFDSGTRQKMLRDLNPLIQFVLLHYNPDIANMEGHLIFATDDTNIDSHKGLLFVPYDSEVSLNFEDICNNTNKMLQKKYNGYKCGAREMSYLQYMKILYNFDFKDKLERWESNEF